MILSLLLLVLQLFILSSCFITNIINNHKNRLFRSNFNSLTLCNVNVNTFNDITINTNNEIKNNENSYTIEYAKENDITSVAKLIRKSFYDDKSLFNFYFQWELESLLQNRFQRTIICYNQLNNIINYDENNTIDTNIMVVVKEKSNKNIIGFIEVGMKKYINNNIIYKYPCIGNLAVDESYRRIGIAQSLLNYAINLSKICKWHYICCVVDNDNIKAKNLYENKYQFGICNLTEIEVPSNHINLIKILK